MELILYVILYILHQGYTASITCNGCNKGDHCLQLTPKIEKEIDVIVDKVTDFLNNLAMEHEDFDVTLLKIEIEKHSDDEIEEKEVKLQVYVNDCSNIEKRLLDNFNNTMDLKNKGAGNSDDRRLKSGKENNDALNCEKEQSENDLVKDSKLSKVRKNDPLEEPVVKELSNDDTEHRVTGDGDPKTRSIEEDNIIKDSEVNGDKSGNDDLGSIDKEMIEAPLNDSKILNSKRIDISGTASDSTDNVDGVSKGHANPEIMILNLAQNGQELLKELERIKGKKNPLLVYVQKEDGESKYVFLDSK
ncbi:uncharacterized protein LOC114246647 [Bombyx mandarina]|uniref:Uncharacterized protein LOC114246647 n=1 Tax=Bombyx mandarina TaxID=7092 RepID=A0A6J2JYW5_BOMMA|nr:uncharacterized protein LOC114246647 [Bombyx mandarina]